MGLHVSACVPWSKRVTEPQENRGFSHTTRTLAPTSRAGAVDEAAAADAAEAAAAAAAGAVTASDIPSAAAGLFG